MSEFKLHAKSSAKFYGEKLTWMIQIANNNEPAFAGTLLVELWQRVKSNQPIEKELFDYFDACFSKIPKFNSVTKALNLERTKKPASAVHLYTHVAFDYKRIKTKDLSQYEAYEILEIGWEMEFTTIEKRLSQAKHTKPAEKMLRKLKSLYRDDKVGLDRTFAQFDQIREEYLRRKAAEVKNPYHWRIFSLAD